MNSSWPDSKHAQQDDEPVRLNTAGSVLPLLAALSACAATDDVLEKPPIVEVFACSDYCPGPQKKYIKKVYEDVSSEGECRRLGGKPYTYFGWRKYTICLAPEEN